MSKDCYYFSHDYHARHDPKLENLFLDHGVAGLGAFWCLVEMLYEQGCRVERNYTRLAKSLRTDEKFIQDLIENYGLFQVEETTFTSISVQNRFQERMEKAKVKAEAGRMGGLKSGEARRKQNEADVEADEANEPKERKGKERKGN
jgi:hypothetical protein